MTHNCQHGLDLRIWPRCYLCKPLTAGEMTVPPIPLARDPGCQCPMFWWGVVPPPCPVHNPPQPYVPTITGNTTSFTVGCTCPPNRGDNYAGRCPIHDTQVTYTGGLA